MGQLRVESASGVLPVLRDLSCQEIEVVAVERRHMKTQYAQKESGYHRQSRVENTFFRYETIIGGKLRARHPKSQKVEAITACNILNRMTILGRPESFAIDA